MAGGAIPIQSNTSCCEEWLKDGEGGHLVDFDAVTLIADHITALVTSPEKRARARERNVSDLLQKLEPTKTKRAVHETYEKLFD
jgi:glycosyltransferase involved in cell wall biosynthesis